MSNELPLYQIVDWNTHFENYKSRSVAKCGFVCVPNKHGGAGLTGLLMSAPEPYGHAFYAVWQLMLQFCSRQMPPREGWLTGDGRKEGPRMPAAEWARMFRCSPALIRSTVRALQSVGFIRLIDGASELPDTAADTKRDTEPDTVPDTIGDTKRDTDTISDTKRDTESDTVSIAFGISGSDDEGKKEGMKEPPSVPQGGTERNGKQSVEESKAWINTFFGRQREWSYEETRLLTTILPISKEDRALLSWAYTLPVDREGWVTQNGTRLSKRKESVLLLLEHFGSELDKWRGKKQAAASRRVPVPEDEPISDEWAETMKKLYGPEIGIPRSKNLLAPSVREEIEAAVNA